MPPCRQGVSDPDTQKADAVPHHYALNNRADNAHQSPDKLHSAVNAPSNGLVESLSKEWPTTHSHFYRLLSLHLLFLNAETSIGIPPRN